MNTPEKGSKRLEDIEAILDERKVVEIEYQGVKYRLCRSFDNTKCAFYLSRGANYDLNKRLNPENGKTERYLTMPDLMLELSGDLDVLRAHPVFKMKEETAVIDDETIKAIVDEIINRTAF